jgi:hypothetical protein
MSEFYILTLISEYTNVFFLKVYCSQFNIEVLTRYFVYCSFQCVLQVVCGYFSISINSSLLGVNYLRPLCHHVHTHYRMVQSISFISIGKFPRTPFILFSLFLSLSVSSSWHISCKDSNPSFFSGIYIYKYRVC